MQVFRTDLIRGDTFKTPSEDDIPSLDRPSEDDRKGFARLLKGRRP